MWRNKFADIAKDHKDLTFVIANEDDFKEVFSIMGFDDNGEELNVGILGEGDRKYPMEAMDEWDSDSIKDFIEQYKNGKCANSNIHVMGMMFYLICQKYCIFTSSIHERKLHMILRYFGTDIE